MGVRHVRFKEWIFGIETWIFGGWPIVASQDTMWPGHSVPLWESHSQGVRAGRGGARVKSEGSPGPGVPGAPGPGGRRQAADLSGGSGGAELPQPNRSVVTLMVDFRN